MKKLIRSYTTFSRTEKYGLIAFSVILLSLIIIKAIMPLWVHPTVDVDRQLRLQASWQAYKRSQPVTVLSSDTTPHIRREFQDASDDLTIPLADTININTADSATLVRLKGIGPVTASNIIRFRAAHGGFSHISQLSDCGHFTHANLTLLSKHLTFTKPKK